MSEDNITSTENRKKLKTHHFLLIVIFISVVVIVFSLPKTKNANITDTSSQSFDTTQTLNIQIYIEADNTLKKMTQDFAQKLLPIDSIINYTKRKKMSPAFAYFNEIKYLTSPIDTNWYNIGKSYYFSSGMTKNQQEDNALLASAVRCFNRAIVLNPKNTNAKIMLASCYVQSTSPMQGVAMLKEIEKTDSNNTLLQFQMAEFALRSNQLDKAIARYKKIIRIDSTKSDAYAYLSEIYLQKKDTLQSIQYLRKFADFISEPSLKENINEYINQLTKKNN